MKARRLDEVLDECLSAYLEGRRSIEESLSLYPALRDELEPLLRTAAELAGALGEHSSPAHPRERRREQFLASASARRRAAALTTDVGLHRRIARAAYGRGRWALMGAAFAVTVAVTVAILDTSSGGERPEAQFLPADPLAPAVSDLRRAQERLWMRANQGADVSPEMIRDLARSTSELESQVRDFSALDGRSRLELKRAISDQFLLLLLIVDTQSADVAPAAIQALDLTEQVANAWGVELPEVPLGVTATPVSPSPGATPPQSATPAPSPAVTATPSPEATATPQPTPPASP